MYRFQKMTTFILIMALISGCTVESNSEDYVLRVSFTPAQFDDWGWAAATSMMFEYHTVYYSQVDLVAFHHNHFAHRTPSIDEIGWLIWDLTGADSIVTGTLSFHDIRSHINSGNPILLHYGEYYNGHYMVLHGYDDDGYVYIHEPNYGTRVVHYDNLYSHYFNGAEYFWESSLVILN